jgi:hypothetical protein
VGNPGKANLDTMVSGNLAILTSGTWPDLTPFDGIVIQGRTGATPVPVSGSVSFAPGSTVDVTDRVTRLLGHETNLDKRLANISGTPQTVTSAGLTTLFTPPAGKSIRLKWLGASSPDSNANSTVATFAIGGTNIYIWDFSKNGGAFAHGTVREGTADQTFTVNLSVAATLHVNFDLETF